MINLRTRTGPWTTTWAPSAKLEIVGITTAARPIALQIALLIPRLASFVGLIVSFRMMKIPGSKPSGTGDGMILG